MASNLSFPSQVSSSEKSLPLGKRGKFGFFKAWYYQIKERKQRRKENLPPEPPYGIKMYVGLPGSGKTVSMVNYLNQCKMVYPGIAIYSNFGYAYEDAPIVKMEDFLALDNPNGVIFAVDEVQLSFQSRSFNNFPPEIIFLLTQNRKFRKHFVCTAQLFEHVDKIFRDLTNEVIDCHGFFNRYFTQKCYAGIDYRRMAQPTFFETSKPKDPYLWKYSFFATDELFASYNTYKVVQQFVTDTDAKNDWRKNRPLPTPQYVPVSVPSI